MSETDKAIHERMPAFQHRRFLLLASIHRFELAEACSMRNREANKQNHLKYKS